MSRKRPTGPLLSHCGKSRSGGGSTFYYIKVVKTGTPCGQIEFALTPNSNMACESPAIGTFDSNNNFIAEDATVNSSRSNAAFCTTEQIDEFSSITNSIVNAGVTNSTISSSKTDYPVSAAYIDTSLIKSTINGYAINGSSCVYISNSEVIGAVFKAHGCGSIDTSLLHGQLQSWCA